MMVTKDLKRILVKFHNVYAQNFLLGILLGLTEAKRSGEPIQPKSFKLLAIDPNFFLNHNIFRLLPMWSYAHVWTWRSLLLTISELYHVIIACDQDALKHYIPNSYIMHIIRDTKGLCLYLTQGTQLHMAWCYTGCNDRI